MLAYMLGALFLAQPEPVHADVPLKCNDGTKPDPLGLDCVEHTGLKATDPRIVVGRIIKVLLGLLGAIFTVLVIYGGFIWMTSAGNDEQVTKARKIISAAIIGLVIILLSYSITNFVLKSVSDATVTDGDPFVY